MSVKIHELRPVGVGPSVAVYESDTVGLRQVVTCDDYERMHNTALAIRRLVEMRVPWFDDKDKLIDDIINMIRAASHG